MSWNFIRIIDKLDTMKLYNWTVAIWNVLMGSIKEFYQTPKKVTGCVVVLLYWLCEHTTVLEPKSTGVFPIFLKWNMSNLLAKIRNLSLADDDKFEVRSDQLRVTSYEISQLIGDYNVIELDLADDFEGIDTCAGGQVHCNVEDVNVSNGKEVDGGRADDGDDGSFDGELVASDNGINGRIGGANVADAKNAQWTINNRGGVPATIDHAYKIITGLKPENRSKDLVIAKLEYQIENLTKALEMQASNLFDGFNGCLKVKDDEIARLTSVVCELKKAVTGLEVPLAGRDGKAADVTYRGSDGIGGSNSFAFGDAENVEEMIHDVMQRVASSVGNVNVQINVEIGVRENIVCGEVGVDTKLTKPGQHVGGEGCVEGDKGMYLQNSFVRNIKGKVRHERKLPNYEYPMARGHLRKVGIDSREPVLGECQFSFELIDYDDEVATGEVGELGKIRTGFCLNNRLAVWKLIPEEIKQKVHITYENHGDGRVVWAGANEDVFVYFLDIRTFRI